MDGTLDYIRIMDWHAKYSPDWCWVTYPSQGKGSEVVDIRWSEA